MERTCKALTGVGVTTRGTVVLSDSNKVSLG